ncbi:ALBU2 protein, partial [Atractosteus spatula]|nr:ALBU2 protein [Atractosteus spatula]
MKWVTLISLVILISFAQCLDLRRPKREANTICQYYTALKEEGFKAIVLVGLAQNLPKSTFEELIPLVRQSTAAAQGCCGDSPSADCLKDEKELFQGVVCSSQEVVTKNELADCCAKQGAERTKCFIEHKKKIPRDLSLTPHLPASEKCEEFEKDHNRYMGHFIFRFSKRNVLLQPQVILGITDGYEKSLTECCKAADAQHCLDAKKDALQRVIEDRITELKSTCVIYEKYGLRILKAKKLVQYSQKLPQATFEEVVDMTDRIAAMTATCCSGDMIQCMKQRKELVDAVCSRDDTLTRTKHLAECCKASVIDRGACIERMKADDKPKDLSAKVESFIKDKDVCQKLKADHDTFLGRFIYEYSRRHQELSIQMILRIGKAYEEILKKCCETDDPPACYGSADADLAKAIHENLQHFKGMCEIEKQKGEDAFEKLLTILFVFFNAVLPVFLKPKLVAESQALLQA